MVAGFGTVQNLTLIWGMAGGGFFLSSFMFGYFNTNAGGCSYPDITCIFFFEKWLCAILIAGILYPIIFLSFYHLVDVAFVTAYHNGLDRSSIFYRQQLESVYSFDLNGMIAWKVYALFLQLTGVMLVGSLYFNKIPLIKTGLAVCLLFFIIYGLNWLIAASLFQNVNDAGPYDHVNIQVGKEAGTLILPAALENTFHIAIAFCYSCDLMVPAISVFKRKRILISWHGV